MELIEAQKKINGEKMKEKEIETNENVGDNCNASDDSSVREG